MQDSTTHDARGIGRFNAMTEWPRYREQMPGTAEGGLGAALSGHQAPGTAGLRIHLQPMREDYSCYCVSRQDAMPYNRLAAQIKVNSK